VAGVTYPFMHREEEGGGYFHVFMCRVSLLSLMPFYFLIQDSALDLLFCLSQTFTEDMFVFIPFLRTIFDYVEDLSFSQIHTYFNILCLLLLSTPVILCPVMMNIFSK
jgi:hypothetical protein